MNGYSYFVRLLRCSGRLSGLLLPWLLVAPVAARAQSGRPLVLTSYYDSARTQRHVVYRARRVGADTVAHGPFRRYWPGGSLQELGHFTEGQADSIWTRYYPAKAGEKPALARRLPMRGGRPEGAFVVWHPDGRVGQRGTFRGGQLVDSLVTLKPDGQRRLTAQLTASPDGRLQGSFWQRGGRYTAQTDPWANKTYFSAGSYAAYDAGRYWTGQLAGGRLVGAWTERDADGQPTVRLSYTTRGRLRLVTRYYPAAWRRVVLLQDYDEATRRDSVLPSAPFWQWEPTGRPGLFVMRYWEPEQQEPRVTLQQLTPVPPYTLPPRPAPPLPQPPPPDSRPPECHGPQRPENHRLVLRQQRGRVSAWMLGVADTTGTSLRPLRRRETQLADGGRRVETVRVTRTYYPSGRLEYVQHRRRLGRELTRTYHPNGQPAEVHRIGLLASYQRYSGPEGHSFSTKLTRLLGVRMVKVRGRTRPLLWQSRKNNRGRPRHSRSDIKRPFRPIQTENARVGRKYLRR